MEKKEVPPQTDDTEQTPLSGRAADPAVSPPVVYIQSPPSNPDRFESRKVLVFGIVIIVLVTVGIVLNIIGMWLQGHRGNTWFPNFFLIAFPAAWTGIFLYLAGGFSVGAGKGRTRCLITANLVLSIIASVFAFILIAMCGASVAFDSGDVSLKAHNRSAILGSLLISLAMLVIAIVLLVLCVYSAVLSGKVICCTQTTTTDATPVVLQMEAPGGRLVAAPTISEHHMTDQRLTPPPAYEDP